MSINTLQQYLEEEETRFIALADQAENMDQVKALCEKQMDRILTRYNSQNISDEQRQHAQNLLEVCRYCLPLVDSTADVKIYTREEYQKKKDAKKPVSRPLLASAFICALLSFLIFGTLAGELAKLPEKLAGILLAALAMLLFFLSGRSEEEKKGKTELLTELRPDSRKIYHTLSGVLLRCDAILAREQRTGTVAEKLPDAETADGGMIRYFSELLECVAAEDSALAQEIRSQAEYYLYKRQILVSGDVEHHPEWFDMMPGEKAVLRPALVQDDKVLSRGLAAGVRR